MNISNQFKTYFSTLKDTVDKLDLESLEKVVDLFMQCREEGRQIYFFGNGGSAANASHIAGDFLKGISYNLEKRFKVLCLNDNMAATTAITNDLTYDEVFLEQIKTFLTPGDVVVGISGSGNSTNVVKAIEWAGQNGGKTVGITGYKGGKLKDIAQTVVHVPVDDMEITEDVHIIMFHCVKQVIIRQIKGEKFSMGEEYDKRVNQ